MPEQFIKFTPERIKQYEKSGYRIVGKHKHTGVEICRWTKSKLRGERNCYKATYGIRSHRCIQMTPTLDFCSFSCKFCWRTFGEDRFKAEKKWDDPKTIVDNIIIAQRNLLSGFGGNPKTTKLAFKEAMKPAHVAISLDGEPTLYPHLPELIQEIKSRGMTAFLVTNGTFPNRLKEIIQKKAFPTNLYISVYATNPDDYKFITNSFIKEPFERVIESLKLMKEFEETRTIFRMTLVKGYNIKDPEGYAKLIKIAEPKFIEFKGYSYLGGSKKRLQMSNMPRMEELEEFAQEISKHTGYKIKVRDKTSRVIVFIKDDETWKWNMQKIKAQDEYFKKATMAQAEREIESEIKEVEATPEEMS